METVSGMPLAIKDSNTTKTEWAIWYTPRPSAPIVRDKYILNKKPSALVNTANNVIVNTALNIDFKFSPTLIYFSLCKNMQNIVILQIIQRKIY